MSAAPKRARGLRALLTTWTYGAIDVAPNRFAEVSVAFGADHGARTTLRLDPEQARELAARLVAAADEAERLCAGRLRALPRKAGPE